MKSDYETDDDLALDYEEINTYDEFCNMLFDVAIVVGVIAVLCVFVALNLYVGL